MPRGSKTIFGFPACREEYLVVALVHERHLDALSSLLLHRLGQAPGLGPIGGRGRRDTEREQITVQRRVARYPTALVFDGTTHRPMDLGYSQPRMGGPAERLGRAPPVPLTGRSARLTGVG